MDPEVRTGQLSNGLTYYVMQIDVRQDGDTDADDGSEGGDDAGDPYGGLSGARGLGRVFGLPKVALVVQAGIDDETPAQRGAATRLGEAFYPLLFEEYSQLEEHIAVAFDHTEIYSLHSTVDSALESLRKVADGNGDRELRLVAIRNMGIVGSEASRTALRDLYSRATDPEIKDAALQGLLISGDDKGVLALYRASKSPDEKRALLRTLSMFDSDAALEAIDQALGERK
jgi:hypothetical protein